MKILIVKTSSLGDIIHSFSALDYLRTRFPHGQIDWVVESSCAELVKAHPQIDRVLVIESKKWRTSLFDINTYRQINAFGKKIREQHYDLLFDLQGNVKSGLIVAATKSKKKIGFGWDSLSEWPNALFTRNKINPIKGQNIREDYLDIVKNYFNDKLPYTPQPVSLKLNPLQQQKLTALLANGECPILVSLGSVWPNKCLSKESMIRVLTDLNHTPYWFIWGNSYEREVALQLCSHFPGSSVLEKLGLPLLQHVMDKCQLVIAMDSLPLHLCGTTSTPTLSFFGPSSALKYGPLGRKHQTIQGSCPYGVTFEKRCPTLRTCPTGACLKNINLEHFERLE